MEEKNPDPCLHRKHAAMIRRLSELHQSRTSLKPIQPSSTTVHSFLSTFSTSKSQIQSQISLLPNSPSPKSDLDSISISISDLEHLLATHSYLLPPYELRSCLNSISTLKSQLTSSSLSLVPKKKFSFKNKPISNPITQENHTNLSSIVPETQENVATMCYDSQFKNPVISKTQASDNNVSSMCFDTQAKNPIISKTQENVASICCDSQSKNPMISKTQENEKNGSSKSCDSQFKNPMIPKTQESESIVSSMCYDSQSKNPVISKTQEGERNVSSQESEVVVKGYDSPGFKGKGNELLVRDFRGEEVGEFELVNLEGCEVRLMGSFRALFVHRLRDCKVYVGAVDGSVLMEDVEDCVFVLASHQIRIHHAKRCDFYLRVRSRPIIEDSNGVRFAPYCLRYDGIDEDLQKANLGEELGNWANVDDFKWLRAVQSPNWSVLPDCDRIGSANC